MMLGNLNYNHAAQDPDELSWAEEKAQDDLAIEEDAIAEEEAAAEQWLGSHYQGEGASHD